VWCSHAKADDGIGGVRAATHTHEPAEDALGVSRDRLFCEPREERRGEERGEEERVEERGGDERRRVEKGGKRRRMQCTSCSC